MNKIYKVIWSKVHNCYVVVSELAKRNGKCRSSLNKKIIAAFLAAGLVTALPMGVEAATKIIQASNADTELKVKDFLTSGPSSAVVWGKGTVTDSAFRGTAFGEGTEASSNNTTAFGLNTKARHHNATSFGFGTYADAKQATAFGQNTFAGTVFTYNGEKVTPVRRVIERVDGYAKEAFVLLKEDGTFVNTGERFDGTYDAKGNVTYSLNYQKLIDKLGKSKASYDEQRNATAFGEFSIATGQDATAFGYRSAATAWSATAWGHETAALGKRSTAFGVETWASGNNSTAFGYRTESTNENTTAWGSNTEATGIGATAWGSYTKSGGDNSTTWGKNSEVGSGSLTYDGKKYTNISIQVETWTEDADNGATYTYTWLDESGNIHTEERPVQVLKGRYFVQGRNESGELERIKDKDEWVWNYNGETDQDTRESIKQWIKEQGGTLAGDYSTAFGDSSKVYGENALGALGGIVNANATNSAAIGKESSVSSANSYAMGNGATIGTDSEGSVALGGTTDETTDGTTDGTTDSKQTKIGEGARNAFAAVGGQVGNGAMQAIAIGQGTVVGKADSSTVKGKQSVAIGVGNTVTGNNSIAIGTKLTVSGNNSGAFGDPTYIEADNSYAIGNKNTVKTGATGATGATAGAFVLGNDNYLGDTAPGTFVVGSGNGSEAKPINTGDTFILGSNVTSTFENSVFLGKGAGYVAADDSSKSTAGMNGYGTDMEKVKINGREFTFAGSTPTGVVSVGDAGKERRIQNVAAGLISADSTDAINGSQLYQAMQALSVQVIGDTDTETKSTKVNTNPEPTTTGGSAIGGDTPGGTAPGGDTPSISHEITLTPTVYEVKASTTELVLGDNTKKKRNLLLIDLKDGEADNDPKSYKYQLDLNKDIDLGENGSVTIGNSKMNNDGLTVGDTTVARDRVKVGDTNVNSDGVTIAGGPSMTKTGIDAAGKKITNVQAGTDPTDAVNVSQLRDFAAQTNQNITNVDSRARKGVAGAAALAALHPLDFDPDDKLTFAAGVGNFRGETAAAIGAFYRPDEKVMFSIGGSMGNGENVVNAGVSFSLDRTPRVTGSRTALTKEVVQLREQVARQDARLARQDAQIEKLTALVMKLAGNEGMEALSDTVGTAVPMKAPALFPDNLDNKWAYDFLEDLEQRGYIHGYAGRSLTRDEFAAALDRAMAGGAKLDERLIKEFEPELSHVRVVHIEGKGEDEGKSYERPRASHDKLEDKHEIEKKHFRVKEKKVTSKS